MRLYAAVLVLAVGALPSGGQSLRLRSDNDAYRFWIPTAVRTDQEYSSGLHLQQERPGAHGWGRLLGAIEPCGAAWGSRCAMTTVGFGQKIFTPRIDSTAWVSGQRPYAGWLYVEGSAAVATARMHRAAGVELGVTGGPSAAAWVQTRVHDLLGMWHPQGWVDQVPFEPALTVRYDEQRLFSRGGSRLSVQLIPGAGASLGSVRTEARAGMRLRVGYSLDPPWAMPRRIRASGLSLYGVAGLRGRAVARDLFLDGSTFGEGPRVARIPAVLEWEGGLGIRLRQVTAEYRVVNRTREYRTEPSGHQYATFEFTLERP